MTPSEIITQVQARTKHPVVTRIEEELQAAYRWAFRRIFNTENGPDLLVVLDERITLTAKTVTLNLLDELSAPYLGIKRLALSLAGDSNFTPMFPTDTNAPGFIVGDTDSATAGHPVFYDVLNFGSVRFSPPLPAGSIVRVDYWGLNAPLDTDESGSPESGAEARRTLGVICDAVMAQTTAVCFGLLNDDREGTWERRAEAYLIDAIWILNRRVQAPTVTTPWGKRKGRMI